MKKEIFIKKANKVHDNKYDYSLVEYINQHTKIKIMCSKHGVFEQKPKQHLMGYGCKKCIIDSGVYHIKKKSKENFISDCRKIHGDKYDYSLVEYKNNKTPVKIISSVHGVFEQTPLQHLILKQNCKYCTSENKKNKKFINIASSLHNNKYDYSLVEYKNNKNPVKIICPIHGVFEQRPDNHLTSLGCKKCGDMSKRLKMIERLEKNLENGYQITPNFNPGACQLFNKLMEETNTHIQHAMNGGEYYIKELGYWLDGYDKENNIVYEFDEPQHKYKQEKDMIREQEIKEFLGCKFIRLESF